MKKVIAKFLSPDRVVGIIKKMTAAMEPADALRYLFSVDKGIYALEGEASVRYGNGLHTKHRHINYHRFFIENLKPGQKVLEIGSGNGALDKYRFDELEKELARAGLKIEKIRANWGEYWLKACV